MNRIPRHFNHILAELVTKTNAGNPGDIFEIVRNERGGLSGTSLASEKEYAICPSILRNENVYHIIEIV